MTTQVTEEELRAKKIDDMGVELGELHSLLWKDLISLSFEWAQFIELFGADPSRIDVMNATAPRFFWTLERALWQDILLSLSRLADPPGTGGQQNLTLVRLLPLSPTDGLRVEFGQALNEFERSVAFARDWRHALYAHRSLDHAQSPEAHPLPPASRADVVAALGAAARAMNVIQLHYQKSETAYGMMSDSIGGGYDLLYYLDRGQRAREQDEERDELWTPRFV